VIYTIQNLSVNDGLTNNVINEMLYQKDTVFAATGDGISVVPANISIPKFNIPVQLIRMSVNQRDTILSSNYKLGRDQHNIQMQFAGIELSGHFKKLRYTLDNNNNWINLDENTLTVQLSSGNHTVQVRAVDVNGGISDKILTIQFDVATPFWKSIWFWLITALALQLIVIYLLNRRLKRRREAKLAKEIAGVQTAALEQQAFTSLMNPHFMFNALNSIQHYINVQDRQNANRYLSDFASLIRKNFEAAQQSFIPLELEVENIKIYLRLEQMRFNDRFSYQVLIDDNLDVEDWMIPTMILQPLLENALLHGIMPSSIDGKVVVDMKEQKEGNLLITITDNGIGIENSLALKEISEHRSRGMELIKKRISALSRFGSHAISIAMSPAFENEKNPGNKVTLFIPAELHQAWLQAQKQ
jgi:two-component sensor histidine kinase